jgi:Tol biopolymer transport system component
MSVIFNESVENPYIDKNRKNRVNKYFGEFIFYVLKNYFKQKKEWNRKVHGSTFWE